MQKKLTDPASKAQPVPTRTHTPAHARQKATRAQAMKM
ncbi:hypothetical protein IWW33_004117 [Pseudomonas sp. BG2dil]|nr:hypothetical protein [Pseudomonas sp. M2]